MEKKTMKAAGLALALVLAPVAAKAVEIYNKDGNTLDLGARFQLQGEAEDVVNGSINGTFGVAGNPNGPSRDYFRIFLFQPENRLKLTGNLDGVGFKFENAMGGEGFAGSNNLYDLLELSADIPVNDNVRVVAGLSKLPNSNASASYEENMLFTSHSELFNMFFNMGYDNTLMLKTQFGPVDFLLGTAAGVPNLPQRYLPETLEMTPPVYTRFGIGNIKDDPTRFLEEGFDPQDGKTQWAIHANGYYVADSNAGHSTLLGNGSAQAEAPKGPFVNGNMMLSKDYNPFMGFTSGTSSLGRVYANYWNASLDAEYRLAVGKQWFVAGGQYSVAQYTNTYMSGAGEEPIINGVARNFGQITAQGAELYAGLEDDKWSIAVRGDVLLPDPQMGYTVYGNGTSTGPTNVGTFTSAFNADPTYSIVFPSLAWKFNKYLKLTAELEHNFNVAEAVDTDGVYLLQEVPIESTLGTQANAAQKTTYDPIMHAVYVPVGRMQLQFAF